jgi:hypothetical protein
MPKPIPEGRQVLMHLVKKLQEVGARQAKLAASLTEKHQVLGTAPNEETRGLIKRDLDRIEEDLREVRRQYEVVSHEVDVALKDDRIWKDAKG